MVLLVFGLGTVLKGSFAVKPEHFLGTVVTEASLSTVAIRAVVPRDHSPHPKVDREGFPSRAESVSIAEPVDDAPPRGQTVQGLDRAKKAKAIEEPSSVGRVFIGSSVAHVSMQDDRLIGLSIYREVYLLTSVVTRSFTDQRREGVERCKEDLKDLRRAVTTVHRDRPCRTRSGLLPILSSRSGPSW